MANIDKIVENIRKKTENANGTIGIILGHCFNDFLEYIDNKIEIPFKDISGLKVLGSDVDENKLVFGSIYNKKVIVLIGRVHYSLGYEVDDIATPIYLLKELGCQKLILCSSVGAINHKIKVGDIVTFVDQINLTGRNPLIGAEITRYGHKFIDMIEPYNNDIINILLNTAKQEMGIKVKKGVVVEFPGPTAETVSETKFASMIGADVIGFNNCCEAIAAKYCNLPLVSYALVTNHASAFTNTKVKHEDIVYNRKCASSYYLELLARFIKKL